MKLNLETKRLLYALYFPVIFVLFLWTIKISEIIVGWNLFVFGNYPHDLTHWYGIFLEPLIHKDLDHLWANTFPLIFLLWALFYFYGQIYFKVFVLIWGLSGAVTWIIGRDAFHIGASGLIYGLAFFLFFSGIIRKRRELMALSAIIAFLYGGIVMQMFPIAEYLYPEVSWEAHLSGALSGIFTAVVLRKHGPQKEELHFSSEEDDEDYPIECDDEDKAADQNHNGMN